MVELVFGDLTTMDIVMAAATGFLGSIVLAIAYRMSVAGTPAWKPRKLVHIGMSSVIGITVLGYSNLSGPALAVGLFLTVLLYAWAHKSDLVFSLLLAGSRENESKLNTFASGFMGLLSYAFVFILFQPRPEVFVAAILAVAWGDAAGEVFGRTIGKHRIGGKTIEGSFGVFLFTVIGVIVSLLIYSIDTHPFDVFPSLLIIGFVIAIIELISIGWTDNFFIPLTTALMMWLLLFPEMTLIIG
jgi:dolichol kinase